MNLENHQRQISLVLRLLAAGLALACLSLFGQAQGEAHRFVPGEVIIQFKADATDAELAEALAQGGVTHHRHYQTRTMREHGEVGITHAVTRFATAEAITKLKHHRAVAFVEPNYIYTHQTVANDTYFTSGYLWGMYGDTSTPANAYGSQAAEAWNAGYIGSQSVCVGIIDEGIQYTHPDLSANVWTNPYDSADGVDNDGNGYADDLHGWNFSDGNNSIYTGTGDDHGTHVAGTIAASGGNGFGVVGVNWQVTYISGRFLGANGGSTADAVKAIDYFVDLKRRHGMNLVALNNSWGGGGYSQALHDAIIRAAKANILFVAAAGNGDANGQGINTDATPNYPSCYDTTQGTSTESGAGYDGVISVAAIDQYGNKATWSNYGARTVDLGAPGVGIYSTLPNNTYGSYSGTSMATPHVTGAAALYASTHPGATALQIKNALLSSVIPTPSLSGKTVTGGRLNLSAIIAPASAALAAPTGLTATATNSEIDLRWTAVSGATSYTIGRATTSGGPYTAIASGVTAAGYNDTSTSLVRGTRYYYVVVAVNATSSSPNSAEASAVLPTLPPASTIPAAPSSLVASALSSSQIRLSWTDNANNETGFKVEVAPPGSGFIQIGTLGANVTSCTVSGAASWTTYAFRIRAYNASGNSAYSNTAIVTTY